MFYLLICNFNGTPLQYSCLENPMDGGAWWAVVHGVAKSRTWLSNFPFAFHFHALEKEMATHSSVLDWRIPGTGEPGELPSMGSHRVGHDWSDLAAAAAVLSLFGLIIDFKLASKKVGTYFFIYPTQNILFGIVIICSSEVCRFLLGNWLDWVLYYRVAIV